MSDEKLNIYQKLTKIQNELKVPKEQPNEFGGYKYRSAEDIQEKLKPLLLKYDVSLYATDSIEVSGGWHYVKAHITFTDGTQNITTCGYAREPEKVLKQSEAQTTGSSSSYARKYALAGLFQLDDTKDPDATNKGEDEKIQSVKNAPVKKPQDIPIDLKVKNDEKLKRVKQLFEKLPEKTQLLTLDAYSITKIEDLPATDWDRALDGLSKFKAK